MQLHYHHITYTKDFLANRNFYDHVCFVNKRLLSTKRERQRQLGQNVTQVEIQTMTQ